MRPHTRLIVAVVLIAAACGGGRPAPAPTSPSPTVPAQNQPPVIAGATITPPIGVYDLTRFIARVEARDPDGDPLSIMWTDRGHRVLGTSPEAAFDAGAGVSPLTVTVTDPRGGIATAEVSFIAGDVRGPQDGYFSENAFGQRGFDYQMQLIRTGASVTGTIRESGVGVGARTGMIDPEAPGQIDAEGRFRLPFTIGALSGFAFSGRLVPVPGVTFPTNYGAEGVLIGGPYSRRPFFFSRHDSFLRNTSGPARDLLISER